LQGHGTPWLALFYKKIGFSRYFYYISDIDERGALEIQLRAKRKTEQRELESMFKIQQKLKAKKLLLITMDEERTIDYKGEVVECVPVWKWVL
jgi:predicted AAA+ superfamily ATPase